MGYTRADWSEHYRDGRGFRRLGDEEKDLLVEHAPAPGSGGRALDACCGTGELAAFLASLGYTVDATDFAEGALARARAEHTKLEGVRWLCLDIEHDDLDDLAEEGYALITVRLSIAFFRDRTRVLRRLAARLRKDGVLVVITPLAEHTPEERRHIALDENELETLTDGFDNVKRFDTQGLAVLVLRGQGMRFTAVEKRRPEPQAVFGAAAVVTDAWGRVLLGRSTRGMWELPGGRIETGESAPAAAVRELSEEAGLTAHVEDAHVITILHDDRLDVRRVTAVVRVTAWGGQPELCEPHRFSRWEWHDLHALAGLGKIFAPSAQALNAVWPGVLPGLPPVHDYPHAGTAPAVAGEPAEAVRLRHRMAEAVIAGGWAASTAVQDALRTVPRHRFAPEKDLAAAYDDNLALVTRRDDTGQATSSVSAAWLQADMLENLRLQPGMSVFEAGSGGYNAELIAHVVGPAGRVITVDIDPYVVRRTRRFTAEAGSGRVTPLQGDGALGAPGHVPASGFNASVITHNVWDIAPAWREQLTNGGRLALPLEIHGYTRAIVLEKQGTLLHARAWTFCGFVRDLGMNGRSAPTVDLPGGLQVRFEDGQPADTTGLDNALHGDRHETATGVTVAGNESFETLQLYLGTTLPGFCRLADPGKNSPIATVPRGADAAATLANGSLAYLTHVLVQDGATPEERRSEFIVHAFGEHGPALAEEFADAVLSWDHHIRGHGYPNLTVYPAGTADEDVPDGHVLDKKHSRLVFAWPPTRT